MKKLIRAFFFAFGLNAAINLLAFSAVILFAKYGVAPAIILMKSGILTFPSLDDVFRALKGGAAAALVVAFIISLAATMKAR